MFQPVLATKTIEAINAALQKDQGATFRKLLRETMPQAEDAYRADEDGLRTHLGASLIGRECPRELWYNFRWYTKSEAEGRMLRLWNRGHLEEARFIALLRMIGCEVWQHDENGKQFRLTKNDGHFGGSLDCVVRGLPDLPGEAVLGEFKTHNEKSFSKLVAEGVRSAKYEHFVQQNIYMGDQGLPWSLYLAVNKNNDDLYGELVPFDKETFLKHIDRAHYLIYANEPPTKLNPSPGWFKCKWCDQRQVCHYGAAPERTCRSCRYARPRTDGTWECIWCPLGPAPVLDKAKQLASCEHYEVIP